MVLAGHLWFGADCMDCIWLSIMAGRKLRHHFGQNPITRLSTPMHGLAVFFTFLAVSAAWVVFKADNLSAAHGHAKSNGGFQWLHLTAEDWLTKWGWFDIGCLHRAINFNATNALIKA